MGYIIMFIIIAACIWLIIKAMKMNKQGHGIIGDDRECLACGYKGHMKTWLANYGWPQFLVIVLLCFMIIPGLIFWSWAWGKYKCPNCGALAKNKPFEPQLTQPDISDGTKKCPLCAETIKVEAIKCRYCGSVLEPSQLS